MEQNTFFCIGKPWNIIHFKNLRGVFLIALGIAADNGDFIVSETVFSGKFPDLRHSKQKFFSGRTEGIQRNSQWSVSSVLQTVCSSFWPEQIPFQMGKGRIIRKSALFSLDQYRFFHLAVRLPGGFLQSSEHFSAHIKQLLDPPVAVKFSADIYTASHINISRCFHQTSHQLHLHRSKAGKPVKRQHRVFEQSGSGSAVRQHPQKGL